jgi:DNA-directed RNA polymerase specialized sigma24 family protein
LATEHVRAPESEAALAGGSAHDLLVRFKHGRLEAIEVLYVRYWGPFRAFGMKTGLTLEEAEDAAQEAFDRMIDRIDTYDERGGGERWMWRICRNEVFQIIRARGPNGDGPKPPTSNPLWFEGWDLGPEFVRCLEQGFASLSPTDRVMIRNRGREGGTQGKEPEAFRRWRDALRACYGELDWAGR